MNRCVEGVCKADTRATGSGWRRPSSSDERYTKFTSSTAASVSWRWGWAVWTRDKWYCPYDAAFVFNVVHITVWTITWQSSTSPSTKRTTSYRRDAKNEQGPPPSAAHSVCFYPFCLDSRCVHSVGCYDDPHPSPANSQTKSRRLIFPEYRQRRAATSRKACTREAEKYKHGLVETGRR